MRYLLRKAIETQEYFRKSNEQFGRFREAHSTETHAQMHFRGLDFFIRIALLASLEQIWCCVEAKEEAMGLPKHIQMQLSKLLKCI